ncbi:MULTISPECIES: restriction endonuclease subunit S [Streptomyces violaceusniger group]|uniref:Restriction endonuclease subunit S n=2 Tax=Streptomyces violaceusniger group TaxID=2839105 RepID=A0A6G4AF87_9ACTN|nr:MULTISPECIES: restriction endonuclease subunit S [Streptomyces violaceusniger group]MBI0312327.1 restriction endonuclease subunit S [Streptomyces javensis]NEW71995.1 restriction endonuclease subunit S [Streptomyces rhizosphaericus]
MVERQLTFADLAKAGDMIFGDGYRTKKSEHGMPGLPILRVAEVHDGVIRPDFTDYVSDAYRGAMGVKVSRWGDIVLTTKGTVGRVAIIPVGSPEFVYSPQVCFFRVAEGARLESKYLYYWFKGSEFWSQAGSRKSQTDMADYLNLSDIRSLSITVPDRLQQQAVVEVVGALDDKIAINERIAATYERLLKLQVDRMGLEADPDPVTAASVTEFVQFNPKVAKPSSEAVYVDMAALSVNRAGISAWARREPKGGTRFVNGDTLLARITPCLENGKTGYVDFMENGEIGVGSTEFIVMRSVQGVPPEFSYFLARSKRFREHAIRNMVGSSGRQRVAAVDAANFYISRPDEKLLAEFGEVASNFFAHVRSLDRESRTLAALRDSLLPQLMSGKLRVRDAEKIVEGAV